MPEFDAPHQQPEQPPPGPEKMARKLPIAFLITILITAAGITLLVWLLRLAFANG